MQEIGHLLFSSSRKKPLYKYTFVTYEPAVIYNKIIRMLFKTQARFCVLHLSGSVIPPLKRGHLLKHDKSHTCEINGDWLSPTLGRYQNHIIQTPFNSSVQV